MKETHQVCSGGCRNDHTFRNFDFANLKLIHCEYRPFHKPVKDIVSHHQNSLPSRQSPSDAHLCRTVPIPSMGLDQMHRRHPAYFNLACRLGGGAEQMALAMATHRTLPSIPLTRILAVAGI